MSDKFVCIKQNKKTNLYENDAYIVSMTETSGYYYKRNNDPQVEHDDELEDDDYKFTKAVQMMVTSKATGKSARKRCYQGYAALDDLEEDLRGDKTQFADIFAKIDKQIAYR